MKAILIDDEKNALEMLKLMLHKHCPEIKIVAMCDSFLIGLDKIKKRKPDLIFLNVGMPQLNGFDLLNRLDKYESDVIFTTGYNQFAIKAFKICALDYLLKPIDEYDLKAAVEKSKSKKNKVSIEQLEILLSYIKPEKPKIKSIALNTTRHLVFVEIDKVIYFESDGNYTLIFLTSGEKIPVFKTLEYVEEILEGHDFFRINDAYLINIKRVKKFMQGDCGYVVMTNNQRLTVSRGEKNEFLEMISKI